MTTASSVTRPAAVVHSLLRNGARYARIRLEILELEISAERERVGAMMKMGLTMSLAALVTAQLIAVLVLAWYWDTPWRLHALGVLIIAAAAATGLAWRALHRLGQRSSRPLTAVMRDLERIVNADDLA